MSLRTKISSFPAKLTAAFSDELNRMGPREKRLVGVLVAAVAIVFIVGAALLTRQSLAEIASSNADTREALAAIALHREEFVEAKATMDAQERRLGTQAPQLVADLEAAATSVGIQIPESGPPTADKVNKRYVEHSVDVTLRQVDLLSLSRFLNKVETGQRVIVVSRMSIKRAFADGEKLNVSLTATTWERVTGGDGPTPASKNAKGKGRS